MTDWKVEEGAVVAEDLKINLTDISSPANLALLTLDR
jgi:hypothetical protein